MAKQKAEISKSESIRRYLDKHPDATPKEIVAALAPKGITVSMNLAGVVKYGQRNNGSKKKTRKGRATASRKSAQLSANDLLEAKKLTESVGGIAAARQALDALEQLL